MRCFSGVRRLVTQKTVVSFRPGDDVLGALDSNEVQKAKCTKRMLQLIEFANDAAFTHGWIVCCVSSIPRWEFATGIQTCITDVGSGRFGVSDGLHRMIRETKCIIGGGDSLAGYLSGREIDDDIVRLQTATSMMSAVLYVCDNSD